MRKVRILVVGSPALGRIVKHLFARRPEFEVVGGRGGFNRLASNTNRPKLIIASVKPVSMAVGPAVRSIKQSSPSSKVILVCSLTDFDNGARKSGADACLEPEKLVLRLLSMVSALSASPRRFRKLRSNR